MVEFKSSLRMNLHTGKRDPNIENAALKTLAAFLNTEGGTLIIGVADDKSPVGIGVDKFRNEDAMGLHLRNIVTSRMGPLAMTNIHHELNEYMGERVMAVKCERASRPVYLREASNSEKFYIRTGPSTTDLPISQVNSYINDRF